MQPRGFGSRASRGEVLEFWVRGQILASVPPLAIEARSLSVRGFRV